MICLGIEGTAHTAGAGVVESAGHKCAVLSNIIEPYRPRDGGIHPREAANHHAEIMPSIIERSAAQAGIRMNEIDIVSFSRGPGLGPCLRTCATGARALSLSLDVPVIGVNHCVAHLEIGCATTPCRDPVLLYVSGGNTQVIAYANGRYRIFGETLDIGLGNMLDKFGRSVGISFPAGGEIERLAAQSGPGEFVNLPYSVKGMDVAFSGILTAAENIHKKGVNLSSLCYSLQETTFAMLTEVTERAMAHINKNEVLLGGGVACNARLREMVSQMAEERGAKLYCPEKSLCIDNGAMIALLGLLMHESGVRMGMDETVIDQRFRTDEVDVLWR
jgi:N6-L-threonylcarbamoyladenine synthase